MLINDISVLVRQGGRVYPIRHQYVFAVVSVDKFMWFIWYILKNCSTGTGMGKMDHGWGLLNCFASVNFPIFQNYQSIPYYRSIWADPVRPSSTKHGLDDVWSFRNREIK